MMSTVQLKMERQNAAAADIVTTRVTFDETGIAPSCHAGSDDDYPSSAYATTGIRLSLNRTRAPAPQYALPRQAVCRCAIKGLW